MFLGLPWPVFALSLSTGLGMSVAVMSVAVTPSAGLQMAPTPRLASVPYGLQFFATMLAAYPLTVLFGLFGRKPVVVMSLALGILAGITGYVAVRENNFLYLCAAMCAFGIFAATLSSFRFAAAELVSGHNLARALALTNFGGTFAALLGPTLVISAPSVLGLDFRESAYLAMVFVVIAMGILIIMTPFGSKRAELSLSKNDRPQGEDGNGILFAGTLFLFVTFCGATGYGIMSGVMIATGLEMEQVGIADVPRTQLIQYHVLAMYGPSLFTGSILQRLGQRNFLSLGIFLLAMSPITGLFAPAYWAFAISLIFLGFGWNFLYVGGSAIIAARFTGQDKLRSQGLFDTATSMFSAITSISAAMILSVLSWNGLMYAGLAMIAIMVALALLTNFGKRGSPWL